MNNVLYVSGKISGLPDLNKPKFEIVTRQLRSMGYIVRNPHEICDGHDPEDWAGCMKKCIRTMMECDILILLDDWMTSRGAQEEAKLAVTVGMDVFAYSDFVAQFTMEEAVS